jgi:hypothetical protein
VEHPLSSCTPAPRRSIVPTFIGRGTPCRCFGCLSLGTTLRLALPPAPEQIVAWFSGGPTRSSRIRTRVRQRQNGRRHPG